jgi:hypothetical protein
MKLITITAIILLAITQPLTAADATNNTAIPADQFEAAVLDIMADHPEIFPQDGRSITPAQLEEYENKIIDKVQKFYGIALTLLLAAMGLFTFVLTLVLEWIRQKSFKKELAEKEAELKKHNDKKIAEALEGFKIEISSKLAHAFCGIADASISANCLNAAMISGILAAREDLIAKKYPDVVQTLTATYDIIKSKCDGVLVKKSWEQIESCLSCLKQEKDIGDHPEIAELIQKISRLVSHNLVLLDKKNTTKKK